MSVRQRLDLRAWWAWWGTHLAAWLPASVRQLLGFGSDRLLLLPDAELQLQLQRDGVRRPLAALPLPLPASADAFAHLLRGRAAQLPRWLLLPTSLGLRRRLLLPAAAGERLRDVLAFEIERQTPFAQTDVLFDGRVLGTHASGQLQVELVVLPKRQFESVAQALGAAQASLRGVDLQDAEGHALGVNLLPPAQRFRPSSTQQLWNVALALVAVCALWAGLAQLLDNRTQAASELQTAMRKREAAARSISAQRQAIVDAVEGGAYLSQLRDGKPSVVEVMDALAQRLPDGTSLEKLAIDGDQLTLIGLSNQAAALVGMLEGAPQWTSPALSGPLQQDPRTRMDRFTLVAKLVVAPQAADKENTHAAH